MVPNNTALAILLALVATAPAVAMDTITLKSGGELRGEIVQESETRYELRCYGGNLSVQKDRVVKVDRGERVAADHLKSLPPGRLPRFDDIVRVLGKQDFLKDLRQIPATVIDVGVLRDVPYQSFRAGDYEVNVYGDPEDPAAIEIGVYGASLKLNQPKANCVRFAIDNVLSELPAKAALEAFNFQKRAALHGPLTIEISPETDPDSYGGWWVDVYDFAKLEKARATAAERAAMTESAAELAKPPVVKPAEADEDLSRWSPADVTSARRTSYSPPSSGGGTSTGRVYVRAYTRRDGTYVPAHTRSKPRRR